MRTSWGDAIDPACPLPDHPNPMLARPEWRSLNGPWEYAVCPAAGGREDSPASEPTPETWDGEILVPFAVEWAASGVGRPFGPDDVLHYRRRVAIPEAWRGRRVVVRFEAVDHHCAVKIDGATIAEHRGGYLPFAVELPTTTNPEVELTLAVRDLTDAGPGQRGKQSLHPRDIWYTATSGIWQSVWMEVLPPAAITRVLAQASPSLDALDVVVEAERGGEARVEVTLPGGGVAASSGPVGAPIRVAIPEARPWSPAHPHLYPVTVTTAQDRVTTWAALRTVSVGEIPGAARGERPAILLNGVPLLLNTPLWQGYWPESGLTPPADDALVADLEAVAAMGFNGVRVHITVAPRRFYHHADRLGLLVVQDAVSGGRPWLGLKGSGVVQALDLTVPDRSALARAAGGRRSIAERRQFAAELAGMIRHLAVHPSVVMWVPFNEAWGQFDALGAERLVRHLDPTRLVDHASGWFDQGGGDVRSRHRYVLRLLAPPRRDPRPFSLSEFGGLNLAVPGHVWDDDERFGYRYFSSQEELAAALTRLYREQLIPLVARGLRACTYTQVTDVEIETNGLLTYDRRVTKVDPALLRTLNGELADALADRGRTRG